MGDTDVIRKHIEIVEGINGPKARIAGSRIRVLDVAVWYEHLQMSVDEILDTYPAITAADIHAALSYYWDDRERREQIEEEIARHSAVYEGLKEHGSLLVEKIRRIRGGS